MKKSIIVFGERGSGKTWFCQTVAKEKGLNYFEINTPNNDFKVNEPTIFVNEHAETIMPGDLASRIDKSSFDVVYFGFASCTRDALARYLAHHKVCKTDADIEKTVDLYRTRGLAIKADCEKHGFTFIDIDVVKKDALELAWAVLFGEHRKFKIN